MSSGFNARGAVARSRSRSNRRSRAAELVALVDEVVGEVEAAVKSAPALAAHPSKIELDLDREAFERFHGRASRQGADRRGVRFAGEAVMSAALKLAALAAFGARISPDDVRDELRTALSDIRGRAGEGASTLMRAPLDS